MNRNNAKKLLPIIQAFSEGKVVQINRPLVGWEDSDEPLFNGDSSSYRIKPEPKFRPFKDAEECWNEMQKHQPFGWVKDRNGSAFVIEKVDSRSFVEVYNDGTCALKEVFENYTFTDGTPFGIKVEE